MTRPLRADAARNRARVLEVAYETFAAEGLAVPIDEIARRAGVGAGTVYRHFPTKEDLFRAVVDDRIRGIITWGRALLDDGAPGFAIKRVFFQHDFHARHPVRQHVRAVGDQVSGT